MFRPKPILLGISLFMVVTSCTTFRANLLLLEITTNEEKAELLFTLGVETYNTKVLGENRLGEIERVIQHLKDALILNPNHRGALEYINTVSEYREKISKQSMATALRLYSNESRSMEEDYQLVLPVKQAIDLRVNHKDLGVIRRDTKDLKVSFINKLTNEVKALESVIISEDDYSTFLRSLRRFKVKTRELTFLDPGNKIAKSSLRRVLDLVDRHTEVALNTAQNRIKSKRFVDAEKIVRQAEFKYGAINSGSIPGIDNIKYELFFLWGEDLLVHGKFETSKRIAILARDIRYTNEVQNLIENIDNRISKRSYEASINDILDSIDYYISKNDLLVAEKIIKNNLNKTALKSNKSALNSKLTEIASYIEKLYLKAEELYKNEDYDESYDLFKIVYDYNRGYRQTESYFTKVTNKKKALSGSF